MTAVPVPLAAMRSYTLSELAEELGVPVADVFTVAEVELVEPELYDPEAETVSEQGRERLLTHFKGGSDPE